MEDVIEKIRKSLPVIMVGGPPHSGKSVLVYNLTQVLRKLQIPHVILRATPDGEGDWSNEAEQSLVRSLRSKGRFTDSFVASVVQNIKNRNFPLIVDIGGLPSKKDEVIFELCTHVILLISEEQYNASLDSWKQLIDKHNIEYIAILKSTIGEDRNVAFLSEAILFGTISNLERGAILQNNDVLNKLAGVVSKIITKSVTLDDIRAFHGSICPSSNLMNLEEEIKTFSDEKWKPKYLPKLLAKAEEFRGNSLAIYGRAPSWLFVSVFLSRNEEDTWMFDARMGWIQPPIISTEFEIGINDEITIKTKEENEYVLIDFKTKNTILSNNDTKILRLFLLDDLPDKNGLIVSGKLPIWLLIAMTRAYIEKFKWIAIYQPILEGAIIIYSIISEAPIGSIMVIGNMT